MTRLALADYLTDFGPSLARAGIGALVEPAAPPAPPPVAPPPPDIDGIVAAEVASVEARLRAEMSDAADAALSVERARHEVQVAEIQNALGIEAGDRIAAAIAAMETRLVSFASSATARILSSILSDDLARRSVDQLAVRIREAVADQDVVRIRISGPQSMFEGLSKALGPLASRCDFAESPGFDMTVSLDGALFETRLAEWSAQIGEILS